MTDFYGQPVPRWLKHPRWPDPVMMTTKHILKTWVTLTRATPQAAQPVNARKLAVIVAAKTRVADDVVAIRLIPAGDPHLPDWDPGAHIDVQTRSGRTRQYSLCGDPADRSSYTIAVRRLSDHGVSGEIHDRLNVGEQITIGHPRNLFPFAHPAFSKATTNLAFVAGGIGITAILPMIEIADRTNTDWSLTYFGSTLTRMPFLDQIRRLSNPRVTVIPTADDGRPTTKRLLAAVRTGSALYYCGPVHLAKPLAEQARAAGAIGFHFERFTTPPAAIGAPFRINLARSATSVSVAADQSALDAILTQLPGAPYSCRQGFCGSCRVYVRNGIPDGRGAARFLAAPNTMLLCTDRAVTSEITVDL